MSEANRLSVPRRTRFGALWEPTSNCSLLAIASPGRKTKTLPFASITRACSSRLTRALAQPQVLALGSLRFSRDNQEYHKNDGGVLLIRGHLFGSDQTERPDIPIRYGK
jgi:hypothetical protein